MSQSMSAPPPADPGMGADPAAAAPDAGSDVVVTICSNGDGSYTVYAGDEPDANAGDMSADDADAMGAAGDAAATPTAKGEPAASIGEALKAAMTILQSDASSQGAPGSADDQFAAGFSASKSPTPAAGPAQKY
jgi:hypothetical protein